MKAQYLLFIVVCNWLSAPRNIRRCQTQLQRKPNAKWTQYFSLTDENTLRSGFQLLYFTFLSPKYKRKCNDASTKTSKVHFINQGLFTSLNMNVCIFSVFLMSSLCRHKSQLTLKSFGVNRQVCQSVC